ncbi:MAG TPA: hypothetical protein VFK14_11845 [Solirubrobacterales bacterium]|nr:hypothetical protein [Solirubrobacterales bacterium]
MTVGLIAAVYFFAVKPALHTTGKIGHEIDAKTLDRVERKVQGEIKRSIGRATHPAQAEKLIRCIRRARRDVEELQRCNERSR